MMVSGIAGRAELAGVVGLLGFGLELAQPASRVCAGGLGGVGGKG